MENQNPDILTRQGKQKINHEGYLYRFHKLSADETKKFWRCEQQANPEIKCTGRLHSTIDGNVLRAVGNHTCVQSAANVVTQQIVTAIKRRAGETMETPQIVRSETLQLIPTPVLYNIPSKNATKKLIKRVRRELHVPPPVPEDVLHLFIPEEYKQYQRSNDEQENFLLADSGQQDPNRILIFGRESFATWADRMKHVFADGTFSITPAPFSQVYVILAKRGKWVLPVLHVLLNGKTEAIYTRMFEMIKQFWPAFNPEHFSLDFERAAINAVQHCFPNTSIDLCLFHMVKNMKKRIGELNLNQRYALDAAFSLKARMITSLAFLPLADLTRGIWALEEYPA